ncbi:hypothetical protein FPANT_3509 [Fusarium pseudoanthophilum]|uniref:Uncharacterized protein n=1 Tax=Fusarium pseudoanthophilum TaxID=48495 RepID=A0A8H5PMU9_9HYPO|nr:hypothetical protein FPANT_3509 [Fusarium pseudoanthophilum]
MSLASRASQVELPTLAQIAEWPTVDHTKIQEDYGLSFYQLLSEVKKIENARERAALQPTEESANIDTGSDASYKSSDSESSVDLSIADYIVSDRAHSEDRETDGQINMSRPAQPYGSKAILKGKEWTMDDAFRALYEEFWCRNLVNNPQDFVVGLCSAQEGDPGHQLWLDIRAEIPRYFEVAAASSEKRPNFHQMTLDIRNKAYAAIDSLYGDAHVVINGQKVPWYATLPKRALWIVDRFCSPDPGWNSMPSHAASILGILNWMDIMAADPEVQESVVGDHSESGSSESGNSIKDEDMPVENHDGPTPGDGQDYHSEDNPSEHIFPLSGRYRFAGNDDALKDFKNELGDQNEKVEGLVETVQGHSKKFEGLKNKVKHLEEKDRNKKDELGELDTISKGQDKEIGRLQSVVAGLETKGDELKKHADEQQGRHKKQPEEVEKLLNILVGEIKSLKSSVLQQSPADESSVITTDGKATESVEDVFGNGTKPSTTQTGFFKTVTSTPEPRDPPSSAASSRRRSTSGTSGLFGNVRATSGRPLDGRGASLKRKASVQPLPSSSSPTPRRSFIVGGAPKSFAPANRASSLQDRVYARTDPRYKENKLKPVTKKDQK